MKFLTIDEARKLDLSILSGFEVAFSDPEGRVRVGRIRLKKVRCGKKNCTKCPHKTYAYAQYRVGDKVTDKYIGVVS